MRFLNKFIKSIDSSKILAVCFLAFCCYTGLGAFASFLANSADAIENSSTLAEYIEVIDEQYSGMLTTEQDNEFFHNKATYINFNGLMGKTLGQPEMNGRVLLKNGHLSAFGTQYDPQKIESIAENLSGFCLLQQERGGNFLFVLAPSQISGQDAGLPVGYTDHANQNADLLASLLKEKDVPVLDLRQKMDEQGITCSDAFFATDHHWTPQTAFWAYTQVIHELHNMNAISTVDPYYIDPSNFDFRIYGDCFLGSAGKRVGTRFAGTEDFCLIIPKFDTEITVTISSKNLEKTGRYENVASNNHLSSLVYRLENPDYFGDDPYGRYGYGNTDMTCWRNPKAPEDKKLLLIGDSMGNITYSLLPLYTSTCDELDMRQYTGDFHTYYESFSPDTVIIFVNVAGLTSEDADNVTFPYVK